MWSLTSLRRGGLENYGAWRKMLSFLLVGFNSLWQLLFIFGERKKKESEKEGGRGREQRERCLSTWFNRRSLENVKMKRCACKICRWGEVQEERAHPGLCCGKCNVKSYLALPFWSPRTFTWMEFLSTRESTAKGRGADPGRDKSLE